MQPVDRHRSTRTRRISASAHLVPAAVLCDTFIT